MNSEDLSVTLKDYEISLNRYDQLKQERFRALSLMTLGLVIISTIASSDYINDSSHLIGLVGLLTSIGIVIYNEKTTLMGLVTLYRIVMIEQKLKLTSFPRSKTKYGGVLSDYSFNIRSGNIYRVISHAVGLAILNSTIISIYIYLSLRDLTICEKSLSDTTSTTISILFFVSIAIFLVLHHRYMKEQCDKLAFSKPTEGS